MDKSIGLKFSPVLSVPITLNRKEEILEYIVKTLTQSSAVIRLFTPNPEIITFSQADPTFKNVVRSAQINIPDGWGVVWALRRQGHRSVIRLSGVDLMENLCELAAERGFKVGFFGGKAGVALKSLECLKQRYPRLEGKVMEGAMINVKAQPEPTSIIRTGLQTRSGEGGKIGGSGGHGGIWVTRNGENDTDHYIQGIVKQILEKNIRILFVALGFPKQEYFIDALARELEKDPGHQSMVLMAVGGSFDYWAGAVPRAPGWLRESGGEWLYRLIREPWRWKRQIAAVRFFWDVIRSG